MDKLVEGFDSLQKGDIIYYDMDEEDGIVPKDGYPSRKKYAAIVGFNESLGQVCAALVNSSPSFGRHPWLTPAQHQISRGHYAQFLKYDSWVNCSDLKPLSMEKVVCKQTPIVGRLIRQDSIATEEPLVGVSSKPHTVTLGTGVFKFIL